MTSSSSNTTLTENGNGVFLKDGKLSQAHQDSNPEVEEYDTDPPVRKA